MFASLSSCKKEAQPTPAPPPTTTETKPACKVNKSYDVTTPNSYWLNTYDTQDRLLKQTYYDQGDEYMILSNKHNEKGQIVEQTWELNKL